MTSDDAPPADPELGVYTEIWFLRASAALGVSPIVLGFLIGAAIAALTPVVAAWSGPVTYERRPFEAFIPYLPLIAIPATVWAFNWTISWADRALQESRPHFLGSDNEIDRARRSLTDYRGGVLWLAGAVGVLWTLPFHEINTRRWSRLLEGDWNAFDLWVFLIVTLISFFSFQVFVAVYLTARALGRAAEELLELDLFDHARVRPIAMFGLRVVFLLAVINALVVLAPAIVGVAPRAAFGVMSAVNVLVSAACIWLSTGGLVQRMRQAKRAEQERVTRAIQGDSRALAGSPMVNRLGQLSFLDLLSYRERVDALSVWPFDASMLGRLLVYAILPPLSWVAGALVEQLISDVMSR